MLTYLWSFIFLLGLEKEIDLTDRTVTDWLGKEWTPESGTKSSHPNSRFCAPASNCRVIDPAWEDPKGVPIDAILFGGRRPKGVPLIYEARSWQHGVFIASSMCSEATAAAEHTGKSIMRDPFAMRPFFGYNAGHYFRHWLNLQKNENYKLPKIFHVNWFRRDANKKFLWPGKEVLGIVSKFCIQYEVNLKLVSAIFYHFLFFSSNNSPSKTEKCFLFHQKSFFCSRDIQIFVILPQVSSSRPLLFLLILSIEKDWVGNKK